MQNTDDITQDVHTPDPLKRHAILGLSLLFVLAGGHVMASRLAANECLHPNPAVSQLQALLGHQIKTYLDCALTASTACSVYPEDLLANSVQLSRLKVANAHACIVEPYIDPRYAVTTE